DEVVHPAALERAAVEVALRGGKAAPRGGATATERAATWLAPARAYALSQARERTAAETKGHYAAPARPIDAIATGLAKGVSAGLEAEARAFGELASGEVARHLIALTLLTLRQRKAALAGLGEPAAVARVG